MSKVTQVEQNLNPGLLVPSLYRLEYGEEKASVSLSQLHPLTYGIGSIMKELLELMAMLCVLTEVKVSWVYSFANS